MKGLPSSSQWAAHPRRRSAILGVMLKCSGSTPPSSAKRKQSVAHSGERRRRCSLPALRNRACSMASASEMPSGTTSSTWVTGSRRRCDMSPLNTTPICAPLVESRSAPD
ncbi:hypothetical protein ACFPRL_34420 [Pseudoclavibacter helvolus]